MFVFRARLTAFAVLTCVVLSFPAHSKPLVENSVHFVNKVIDGDTLILAEGQHVRLLGINAPEVARKSKRGESGGQFASAWLKRRVENEQVYLRFDTQKRDKYRRNLAHIFMMDGRHINHELVQKGLAIASIIPPNMKYTNKLLLAQRKSEESGSGLWQDPSYAPIAIKDALKKDPSGWKRVIATPIAVLDDKRKDKKYVRLIINEKVDVRIPRTNLNYFPEISTYVGQKLEIRGWVSKRNGRYSILARHPSVLITLGIL